MYSTISLFLAKSGATNVIDDDGSNTQHLDMKVHIQRLLLIQDAALDSVLTGPGRQAVDDPVPLRLRVQDALRGRALG